MNKFASITAAAALAVMTSLSAATPSSADPAGVAVVGGVLGFMAGAAAASGGLGPHYVYRDSDYGRWRSFGGRWGFRDDNSWRGHIRACFRVYGGAYDPRTDTYIGRDRRPHRCRV